MHSKLPPALLILALTGCAAQGATPAPPAPVGTTPAAAAQPPATAPVNQAILGQVPIPPGAKILTDQSLIMGSGDTWLGRVSLDAGRDAAAAYGFFLDGFPQQGWTLISAVRGKTSLLVFVKAGRTATVEFHESALVGSVPITLTIAPTGSGGGRP